MEAVSVDSHLGEGKPMEDPASARLFDFFAHVSDPRRANARHRLFDIVVIALCAVISGKRTCFGTGGTMARPRRSGSSSS